MPRELESKGRPAKFPGWCARCGERFPQGAPITWVRAGGLSGLWYHSDEGECGAYSEEPLTLAKVHANHPKSAAAWALAEEITRDGRPARVPTPEHDPEHDVKPEVYPDFNPTKHVEPTPEPTPTPAAQPEKEHPMSDLTTVLVDTILPILREQMGDVDKESIERKIGAGLDSMNDRVDQQMVQLQDKVDSYLIPTRITISRPDLPEPKEVGLAHYLLPALIRLMMLQVHTYLWGAPGSSKTHSARQAAEAAGLWWGGQISLNPQTPAWRLEGYMNVSTDAYVPTELYTAMRDGAAYCIDEADNASGSTLTTLNSAYSNQVAAFPCGTFNVHPMHVLVATGNTPGMGPTEEYRDRRALDGAFRDRLFYIKWPYDTALERTLAGCKRGATTRNKIEWESDVEVSPDEWCNWVHRVREYVAKEKLRGIMATPRASIMGSKLLAAKFAPSFVADGCVFKGADEAMTARILEACPLPA